MQSVLQLSRVCLPAQHQQQVAAASPARPLSDRHCPAAGPQQQHLSAFVQHTVCCGHTRPSLRASGFRTSVDFTPSVERQVPLYACVEDIMTKGRIFTVRPDTTIDEALEILVKERITGMPVIDNNDAVVGVVSDFDLLSLDGISGKMRATGMFPDTNTEWSAFFEVQKLLLKNTGKLISDVMTPDPMVVRGNTDLEAAARLLLERRIRRMPVVDSQGRLVGIFSRGDVIRAALTQRQAAAEAREQQA